MNTMEHWMSKAYGAIKRSGSSSSSNSNSSSKQAGTARQLSLQTLSQPSSAVIISSSAQASNSGQRGGKPAPARSAEGETVACHSEARPIVVPAAALVPPKPQPPQPHQPQQQQQQQQLPAQPPLQRADKAHLRSSHSHSAAVAPSGERNLTAAAQSKPDGLKPQKQQQSSSQPQSQPPAQSSHVQPPQSASSSASASGVPQPRRLSVDRTLPRVEGPHNNCNPLSELLEPESAVTVGQQWKMDLILAALKGRLSQSGPPPSLRASRKYTFEPCKPKDKSKNKHKEPEVDVTIIKHEAATAAAAAVAVAATAAAEESKDAQASAASKAKKKRDKQKLAKQKQHADTAAH